MSSNLHPSHEALIEGLNPAQAQAVTHRGSPLLVVAGAGSGKTRVLTRRIAYLLGAGNVAPWEILAITFTNKAAGEMKERVASLVGPAAKSIWVSTFHSACVRILRHEAANLGYGQSFTIYDSSDSLRLITKITKDMNIDSKRFAPKAIAGVISDNKNELIGPADYINKISSPFEKIIGDVYAEYQRRLALANAFDFDDLISKTIEVLQRHPEVKAKYRSRFKHILVDEYQDTNHAQYILIRELVGSLEDSIPPAELCVVGDADQSIYGFRGANIRNILQFESDYSNAETVLLEENYRSTQNILSAANAVISNNKGRKEKNLWSSIGAGQTITGYIAGSDQDEARFVIDEIVKLQNDGVSQYGDTAIFYRTNAQSRPFEEAFTLSGIPYKVVGGVRFYERREVKDFLAYLKVISNNNDEVSLRRIINTPKRGIGDRALDVVDLYAAEHGLSLWEAFSSAMAIPGLPNRSAIAIRGFVDLISELAAMVSDGQMPSDIASEALDRSGLREEFEESDDLQDESRVENLEGLINVAKEYEEGEPAIDEIDGSIQPISLQGFLEKVSLVADSDQIPEGDDHQGIVTLMTIHTAKGLEFPTVFLTGMEDGVFPHMRTLGDADEIEEERRLAYVALTRAKQRLCISRSTYRMERGAPSYNPVSRFVSEIPTELIEWRNTEPSYASRTYEDDGGHVFGRSNFKSQTPRKQNYVTKPILAPGSGPRAVPTGKTNTQILQLVAGDRVAHDTFGLGKVVEVSGEGDRATATIDFGSLGEKRLLLRFAPVSKL